jgi:hypothetical protein
MRDIKLKCAFCDAEKSLEELFKCYYCKKICCNEHIADDYAVCPECRKDNESAIVV